MQCPLQSEFEAALSAFLLGAVHRFFPLPKKPTTGLSKHSSFNCCIITMITKYSTLQIKKVLSHLDIILPNKTKSEENYFSSQVHSIMAVNVNTAYVLRKYDHC
ncbi:fanconi anemia group M protein [Trichinella spiralis]|uniref:fanconi anemia group M protein n=1 Tax=Trichinella spiralis TaxID=6334 RepID=UPI0001EFEA74|nr:fanconi anemia group M protein [Trichinella spiralis]